jgi:hypothetical protein
MLAGSAECAVRALVYSSPVFCLLALAFSAKLIRRRIASEREGLSFCCFAQASILDVNEGERRTFGAKSVRSCLLSMHWIAANHKREGAVFVSVAGKTCRPTDATIELPRQPRIHCRSIRVEVSGTDECAPDFRSSRAG